MRKPLLLPLDVIPSCPQRVPRCSGWKELSWFLVAAMQPTNATTCTLCRALSRVVCPWQADLSGALRVTAESVFAPIHTNQHMHQASGAFGYMSMSRSEMEMGVIMSERWPRSGRRERRS